jgi:hypothetical protein
VVGRNQSQTITITYAQPDGLNGESFESGYTITHPIIDKDTAISTTILASHAVCPSPQTFPEANTTSATSIQSNFVFHNPSQSTSIAVICQPYHYRQLQLAYYLSNGQLTPIETQVTLPPDTATQRLLFDAITPQPLRLYSDADGNRIASFRLEPQSDITVTVQAKIIISSPNNPFHLGKQPGKSLTQATNFWPTTDSKMSQQLPPEATAESIYTFLINQTQYNPDRFDASSKQRLGGKALLTHPQDMQLIDYVDVLITLLRAQNIPSRRIIGLAQTPNQALMPLESANGKLHTWVEYYDIAKKQWFAVDPGWQKSAIHRNFFPIYPPTHIALAINGHDDSTPHPVGFFPPPDSGSDIIITTIEAFDFPDPTLEINLKQTIIDLLTNNQKLKLTITNHSSFSLHNTTFTLILNQLDTQSIPINYLPLGGQETYTISGTIEPTQLKMLINQTEYDITINRPTIPAIPTITALVVTLASIGAIVTRRLLVSRRSR